MMVFLVFVQVSFDKALSRFEDFYERIFGLIVEKEADLQTTNWTELCFKF
jgi:hypothetical protein